MKGDAASPEQVGVDDVALIDREHLARQTFGDPSLEREVLGLFAAQSRSFAAQLSGGAGVDRRAVFHSIKGSARAVGAFPVGDCAAALEDAPDDPERAAELQQLMSRTAALIERMA